MQESISLLDERKLEIDIFFTMLQKDVISENDEVKILRATSFLLLYNIIEATITRIILDYHNYLSSRSFAELTEQLKSYYIDLKLSECKPRTTHYEKYINKSKEIVEYIVCENAINFDLGQLEGRLPISGNVDNQYIVKLLKDNWGIAFNTSIIPSCITEIKNKRNALSHGRESFLEVGRNLSMDELLENKVKTIACLSDLLEVICNHISNSQ